MAWNGNTTETKTDIAKFISFRFKFFRFRFVSVFRNIFVSVFVSVNGIKIFPLTDISVSVSVNVNHTGEDDIDAVTVNSFKNRLERRRKCQMDFFKDWMSTSPLAAREYWNWWTVRRSGWLYQVQPHPVNDPVNKCAEMGLYRNQHHHVRYVPQHRIYFVYIVCCLQIRRFVLVCAATKNVGISCSTEFTKNVYGSFEHQVICGALLNNCEGLSDGW